MRKFTDEELSQDQVVTLLKAALMSPSSKRSNPWQFIVVDDKETLQKLSLCKEMGAAFLKDDSVAGRGYGLGQRLDSGARTVHGYRHPVGRFCTQCARHSFAASGAEHRSCRS